MLNTSQIISTNSSLKLVPIDLAKKIPASPVNPEDYLRREPSAFEIIEIDPSRVLNLLLKTDIAKGTSLDQISHKVLKFAAQIIYRQLTDPAFQSICSK